MRRAIALALSLSFITAGPALANRCPRDMAAIDKAVQTAQLSSADRRKVMNLRQRGEAAHKAGNHEESERLLDEAKRMLKI
ncbi:hypothetical protein AA309_21795 [Microvirga vignae]|uniref:Uncharacterized protein n=1 Tax=Microvirga vignae TaxID=1225564 RepID=A0A0H1R7G4_9HYPH|nr:hypothetical protein [Microvirga vignae]KLK91093.1 hypothetical protein AA309_21795 [Microvirga vignae]